MSAAQWALWFSIAAFVAAAGKFIDDYHIKITTKAVVRNALIKWFQWLDARKVPDLGGVVLGALRGLFQIHRFLLLAASSAFTYWAALSAFYLGRAVFGPANDQSYTSYLSTWIPLDRSSAGLWGLLLNAIAIPEFIGLFVMAHYFHRASMADGDAKRLGLLAAGLIFGLLFALSGIGMAMLGNFELNEYTFSMVLFAGLASITLPALLAICTLLLIVARLSVNVIRFLLLEVFGVAKNPAVSPFTYVSSLLGVLILGAKVVQVVVTQILH